MRASIRNLWENKSVTETATLAFWNLALIAFIGGAAWMARGVIANAIGPDCADTYRVTDPRLSAVLFLQNLQDQGHFDPEQDMVQDFAWVLESGQLRFMMTLNTGMYTATACYAEGKAMFQDLEVLTPDMSQPE